MQVYRDTSTYRHHPAAPYSMDFAHPKSSPSSQQYSQYSQYPFNPYPHQDRDSQEPEYTLRDHTTPTTAAADELSARSSLEPSSNDPLAPPRKMFFALERLLMSYSPFPPPTATNFVNPTCSPLDDRTMPDMSLSPSPASVPSMRPSGFQDGQSLSALEQCYAKQPQYLAQNHPNHKYQHRYDRQSQQRRQRNPDSSLRSLSPTMSQYSYGSSSPNLVLETEHDLPYWSPSTPSLQANHEWSNHSSPLVPPPQKTFPSSQGASWNGSLFEQMGMPYELPAHYTRHHSRHHHHYHQQRQHYYSPSNSTSSLTSADNARTSAGPTSNFSANSGYNANMSTVSSSGGSISAHREPKSYPCATCSKPFPTRTQLKSHMAIHVDDFPFPCLYSGCDLHFKRKHDLRRHVDAKHALVKKYLCSGGCGEGFGRRDQMVRHTRRGVCAKSFRTD